MPSWLLFCGGVFCYAAIGGAIFWVADWLHVSRRNWSAWRVIKDELNSDRGFIEAEPNAVKVVLVWPLLLLREVVSLMVLLLVLAGMFATFPFALLVNKIIRLSKRKAKLKSAETAL